MGEESVELGVILLFPELGRMNVGLEVGRERGEHFFKVGRRSWKLQGM